MEGAPTEEFRERLHAYVLKALREAKLHSDWSEPNATYEGAMGDFITWLFDGPSPLLNDIAAFARRIAPAGAANGLAQTLIKLTIAAAWNADTQQCTHGSRGLHE